MIKELRSYIHDEIDSGVSALTGNGYEHYQSDFDAFPSFMVTFDGSPEAEPETLRTTSRIYSFNVRLVVDVGSDAMKYSESEDVLADCTDGIIDLFENKRKADGNGDFLKPVTGKAGWLDTERKIRYIDIIVSIRVRRSAS